MRKTDRILALAEEPFSVQLFPRNDLEDIIMQKPHFSVTDFTAFSSARPMTWNSTLAYGPKSCFCEKKSEREGLKLLH